MKKILFNLQLMVTNKKEREKNRAKFVRLMLLFFGRRPPRHLMVTVELVGRRHSSSSCLFVVVFFVGFARVKIKFDCILRGGPFCFSSFRSVCFSV